MEYEWSPAKAAANLRKHGVEFADAASVFLDPLATTYEDPDHSVGEQRFITIGSTASGRLILVAHQDVNEERVRIISARLATKRERHAYSQEK